MTRTDLFWDKYGLLHVEPGTPSENGILFASEYHWSEFINGGQFPLASICRAINVSIVDLSISVFRANPPENGEHFSHDNMTGLYCLAALSHSEQIIKELPICYWNSRWWVHPRDLIFYNLIKGNVWSYLFVLLLGLFSYISCSSIREKTSGKMLVWMRLTTLLHHKSAFVRKAAKIALGICESKIKSIHGSLGWFDVASIYFKNPEHPVRVNMGVLYGNTVE